MMNALWEVRTLARQFAREQLRPNVERWDHERALDGEVMSQLAELGFLGMTVPESFGGMEFDLLTYTVVIEELAWGEPVVALLVARGASVTDLLVRHGSEPLKREWLERLASGDAVACTALADAGAHGGIRATTQADGWRLDGTSGFVVNGGNAQAMLVRAERSEGGAPELFLVPADSSGFSVVEREATMGFRALDVSCIALEDVRLGEDAALRGARIAAGGTDLGRLSVAAIALGIAQAALDHAIAYADQREQFGEKLRAFEGIQLKLADMSVRVLAARALVAHAASAPTLAHTAAAKVLASEAAMWVSTQAVQVFGGYGYMRDYPVEKTMRDAKGTELLEGANEELRVLIARELYSG